MKKKILYIALAVSGAMGLGSCSLDEYNPSAGSSTLTNYDTWAGLQVNCYSTLYHELYSKSDFLFISEGGTDLWLNPSGVEYAPEVFYYKGLGVARSEPKKTWQQAYSVIATCNTVIEGASAVTDGNQADIAVRVAEAKVIRAFMHLTLTTYFGPIPLCTNVVGENNTTPVRNSIPEVYASIIKDLTEAAAALPETQANYARVTKKTANGLLARAYAQGAGEGLAGYWEEARKIAVGMIDSPREFGLTGNELYNDVSDMWAQNNNRGNVNKEYLFVAAGLDANGPDAANAGTYFNATSYLYAYMRCNPNTLTDVYPQSTNFLLGTHNQGGVMAPTKHALEVFGDWDKRYENTFITAYSPYTLGTGADSYARRTISITSAMAKRYGLGETTEVARYTQDLDEDEDDEMAKYQSMYPAAQGYVVNLEDGPNPFTPGEWVISQNMAIGKKIYPYAALKQESAPGGQQTYFTGTYAKGGGENLNTAAKNPLVIDMPLAADEDRVSIYLYKGTMTDAERKSRAYVCMPIADLFGDGADYDTDYRTTTYKFDSGTGATTANKLYPSCIKYNWVFNGATRHLSTDSYDFRNGDIPIMRMAEIYLIAAEAYVALNKGGEAVRFIKKLQDRACRPGYTAPQVQNVTEQDILDEYAREFAGEHMRWPVLKRHHALKQALQQYNKRAANSFNENIHYCRPIPQTFLDQISNAAEFGDNGYGYTGTKGY